MKKNRPEGEEELYPPLGVPNIDEDTLSEKPKPVKLAQISVRRYGTVVDGKQICLDTLGTAYLVPTEKVAGKDYFVVDVDETIEKVYNWRDDLNSMLPQILEAAHLALLRAGYTTKREWTPEVRSLVSRSILAAFDNKEHS